MKRRDFLCVYRQAQRNPATRALDAEWELIVSALL